jgi:hypothetical protein
MPVIIRGFFVAAGIVIARMVGDITHGVIPVSIIPIVDEDIVPVVE